MARNTYGYWAPYVKVADRKRQAAREVQSMRKGGRAVAPVVIGGRTIANTFWGKAWCDNLEAYSDFANRLPRGRTYVRNGSVIDLQIREGEVTSLVSGSEIYKVKVSVRPLSRDRYGEVCAECAGAIDSVVELLAGRLSRGVMERLCRQGAGLFPEPQELSFSCSCPDWASMCKHVAATLYGVGARLDDRPELLFTLRQVDQAELVTRVSGAALVGSAPDGDLGGLEDLFGIELDEPPLAAAPRAVVVAPLLTASPPSSDDLITAQDLLNEGIPRSTFGNWVTAGHLRRTESRGVYLVTEAGWERINRFVASLGDV